MRCTGRPVGSSRGILPLSPTRAPAVGRHAGPVAAPSGLPHPSASRSPERRSPPATSTVPRQAGGVPSPLLSPVINATGVLAAHQPRARAARAHRRGRADRRVRSRDRRAWLAAACRRAAARPALRRRGGDGRQQQRRRRAARPRRARPRARRAGESGRERRDRWVVPCARGDGAVRCPPGRRRHDEPHPPRRLPPRHRPAGRRRRHRAEGPPEQLSRRGLRRGDLGRASWRRSGCRWSPTSAAG